MGSPDAYLVLGATAANLLVDQSGYVATDWLSCVCLVLAKLGLALFIATLVFVIPAGAALDRASAARPLSASGALRLLSSDIQI